ncbi:MAG TPA: arylsulfatase [Candidatus Anammoximicrobium sp.]|nr:arylsulfatase [Candidatus Anammoximicrobium sp.]
MRLLTVSALAVLCLAILAPSAGADSPSSLAGRRPNIILVLTDDQGYGDVARHGNPIIQTPNLDRMYDASARLTDYHVSPTCAPTRCSIMTGRHEFKSGVTHTIMERERMSLKATTIAQLLQSAGYRTGIFGKWHLGDEPERWPSRRGFHEMFIHGAGGIGQSYPGTCGDAPGNSYFDPVILHNGTFEKTSGYCTDVFFGQAIRWIEKTKGSQPFFAYITPNAPHGPLICPENYEALYRDKVKENVAKFLGMVTNIDDNMGRLLAKLKELEIERNTLVIFMNDNGGTAGCSVWNAGMRGQKGSPDNGGTRAIGFFRWPGTLTPGDRGQLTAHLDLYPTFAALAGAKIPDDVKLDGYSLLPLLEHAGAAWPDRYLVTHVGRWPQGEAEKHKYSNMSVRRGPHLLVSRGKAGKNWELYDLKADPAQQTDLAARQPEVVAQLEAYYDGWWAEVVPCLENEDAAATAPQANPFKTLYWKQYGGPGPNNVGPNDRPVEKPARKPGRKKDRA